MTQWTSPPLGGLSNRKTYDMLKMVLSIDSSLSVGSIRKNVTLSIVDNLSDQRLYFRSINQGGRWLDPMLLDRQIVCQSCGGEFTFTADEQSFYETKGFQEPKKCKPCRDAAKQNRGGGGGSRYGGGGGGGYGRPPRQLYDAVCASCGIQTQVPFQPNGTKPVYCRDCFQGSSM